MGIFQLIDRSRDAFNDALTRIWMLASAPSVPLRRALDLAQLEDRIMLSASPVDLLIPVEPAPEATGDLATIAAPPPPVDHTAPTTPDQAARNVETQVELVFVDQGVQDYEQLVVDLFRNADPVRHFEVVLLDENRDGIEQISDVLQSYTDLSAIHLVSHGTAGKVSLGNLWLSDLNIDAYAGRIAGWSSSLRDGADLLIYGCDLASTASGRTLTETLGALCGCDVAASDDDTGHEVFGADWVLEFSTGNVETEVAFSEQMQASWGHLLNVTVDTTSTTTTPAGALTDSVAHTTSGTDGLMLVAISFGQDSGDSVTSVTYNGRNLTLVGAQEHGDIAKARVEIWSLLSPDVGTYSMDVNYSGSNHQGATIGVITFNDVNQTVPLGNFAGGQGTTGNPTTTVVSTDNDLVFGVAAVLEGSDLDLTPGAGQAEHWDLFSGNANGSATTESGAASVEASWTFGSVKEWAAGAVSIKPNTSNLKAFQEGVAGYTGAVDTYIESLLPNNSNETVTTLSVDGDGVHQALIRFDNLFGNGPGQIPLGSTITSAELTVTVTDGSSSSANITLHRMLTAWNDTDSWNGLGAGIQFDDAEAAITADSTLATPSVTGQQTFYNTGSTLQAWSDGAANHGWAIQSDHNNELLFRSSEDASPSLRPRLTLEYTPPESIWLSTQNDVIGSGTPGITSWDKDTLLKVGDPNFSLEAGTNGTFSSLFDLVNNFGVDGTTELTGLHVVKQNVLIGGSVWVQEGDVLFTINGAQPTLTSTNTLTTMNKSDVVRFRPDTPGDYTTGTFERVLDDPLGTTNIGGISLVEKDTLIGDRMAYEGDFLLVETKGIDDIIHHFTVTGAGEGTTSGSTATLITGTDIGIGTAKFTSVHLVSDTMTVGGAPLAAGDVLVSLDGTVSNFAGVPTTTAHDVVALTVTQTTVESGSTAATGTLVFQGADVNLGASEEAIEAFSLVTASDDISATIADNFDDGVGGSSGYAGNDGSQDWTGNWIELDEADGPTLGKVRINGNALNIYGNGGDPFEGAYRVANLSAYTTATLSFDYNLIQGWSSRFRVQVSTDGIVWSPPALIYDSNYTGVDSGSVTVDISAYISSTTHVRFWQDEWGDNTDHIYFDNIQIEADGPLLNTLTVDTTSDISDGTTTSISALLGDKGADGKISLREAIEATNNTINGGTPDEIHFEITDPVIGGAHTIQVTSALPDIVDAVVIDGTTDADFAGTPIIVIDGSGAGG